MAMRAGAILFLVGAAATLGGLGLLRAWPAINVVETGKTPEYPDIVPRVYRADADRVFDAVLHAVHRLPRWSLVAYRPETSEVHAEARTRLLKFVDDVLIRIVRRDDGMAVEVRSASRVGRSDFGQNARNIRAFFDALDKEMQRPDRPE
jgi:uncharacterized protein (DUF1499 family)